MSSRKWLILMLAACGLASACSQYNTNISVQTSSSTLSFVSPTSATVGSQGFTITANGSGFVSGAYILWNGNALTTTFVSSVQLTAPVPASDLTNAGTVQVAIEIPNSAVSPTQNVSNTTTTAVSNIVLFTINSAAGPSPTISSLSASTTSQASTPYCSPQGITLTVTGTNFTSDALVNWNGSARTTTYVSATQLTAAITPMDTAFPGTAAVTISNSIGASGSRPFTMTTPTAPLPTPMLSSITPNSAPAGSPPFTLSPLDPQTLLPKNALVITASQGSFLPCTVVQWTDSSNVTTTLPTEYILAAPVMGSIPAHPLQLDAAVPAADLLAVQTAQVFLSNPPPVGPGGNTSLSVPFTISPPVITSLSASTTSSASTPSCSNSGFTLTVNGSNFLSNSLVNWNGSSRTTTFVSSTQLTAQISAQDIAAAGTAMVTVNNSAVASNQVPFTISPASSLPTPAIASLSQTTATAGTAGFTLNVSGSNFVRCSGVLWNNSPRQTTYVGSTQLQVAITTADLALKGMLPISIPVTVSNPATGGATSNSMTVSIVRPTITSVSLSGSSPPTASTPACSPSGFTLAVNGTNFVSGVGINWNGSPRPTTYISPTQLTAAITPADTAFIAMGAAAPAVTVSTSTVTSNSAKFSLTTPTPLPVIPPATSPPAPTITSISPSNATVNSAAGPALLLTVTGSEFFPCSAVQFNGADLPATVFIGTTGITSLIPATDIASTGTNQVSVSNPPSLGGASGTTPFTVLSGSPVAGSPAGTGGVFSLPLMSAGGRYAAYVLASTGGVNEDTTKPQNIFLADTCTGAPSGCMPPPPLLVSVGVSSNPANGDSITPSISANGRFVAFISSATNLVSSGTNGLMQAFVRDTCSGVPSGTACTPSTQLASVANDGVTQANGASTSATISADGRYATFVSAATNLVVGTPSSGGVFLRDTCAGAPSGCTPSTQLLSSQ